MHWRLLMGVLWPSFLAAGVGSALIFALIDPLDVLVLGRWQPSRLGFYTVSFFVLWLIAAFASALTAWLVPRDTPDGGDSF
ncbi:hypothetical protein [Bordetella petrii]|uniref:Inner membrane protein n=1 Tax=Bordetella petrii (strain ATCC BAA-461 / DSM 12804 / CCUG 43448 / CIP 107267 / Se-1111R) TaxID=340100 RepID=A9IUS8_BORPD|nr:hypothetical protein [Bordetella petrii]CAP43581.1 putative inner membrane protein [Bordetella petrii]